MRTSELDYELPEELIAQHPLAERDGARMLVLERGRTAVRHLGVLDIPAELPPSLLVVNDTKVLCARLHGQKPTGGRVELLLIERLSGEGREERWSALGRASKGLRPGAVVDVGSGAIRATVEARHPDGELEVSLVAEGGVAETVERVGAVPLPPYIRRAPVSEDRQRYQTVFAERPGAVAAPTAGLHLSRALLDALATQGHRVARVTLHVGPGTFAPVKVEDLSEHPMHSERWQVSEEAALEIGRARAEGRPVVAVGTTVVRTLESAVSAAGEVDAGTGSTGLFIQPPFEFRIVQGLLTNFHLPRSTLLALVMAFAGVDAVRGAYAEAVREGYRFFSYGDAMLIRPEGR